MEPADPEPRSRLVAEPAPTLAPESEASTALQSRIVDLVSAALDDVTVSEVERLEGELATERAARERLERDHAEELASRDEVERAAAEANEQIEALGARIERLQRKLTDAKEQRDRYKAERGELREQAAEAEAARERERELRDEDMARVRERAGRASSTNAGLERSLAELEAAIAGARAAADEVVAAQSELDAELTPAD